MSSENFDKKVREKLVRHIPKYEPGAWDSFKKMLPSPWYIRLFRDYGGWLFGGLATTTLLVSTMYQTQKTEELNDKIFILSEKLENQVQADTVYLENRVVDTVYIKEYVPVERERVVYLEKNSPASGKGLESDSENETDIFSQKPVLEKAEANAPLKTDKRDSKQSKETYTAPKAKVTATKKSKNIIDTEKDDSINDAVLERNSNGEAAASERVNANEGQVSIPEKSERTVADVMPQKEQSEAAKPGQDKIEATPQMVKKEQIEVSDDKPEQAKVEIPELKMPEEPERENPEEKPKKKINWPETRVGLSSDLVGFKNLITGPAFEVFLSNKFSFNTGVLFSGQIESRHPLERDFNRKTGKQFEEEYKRFINNKPPMIKDISIKTSFVKMPVFLSYYINTPSRFSFMVSAGTKLDLSVYQDVGFVSGALGNQLLRRFEARPRPKVFNSFFYATGVQYKYKNLLAQLSPYFDFQIRKPDYFTPNRNVGMMGAIKFAF